MRFKFLAPITAAIVIAITIMATYAFDAGRPRPTALPIASVMALCISSRRSAISWVPSSCTMSRTISPPQHRSL